jgi:hypothetical protein
MNIIKMAILPNNLHVNCHPQQNPMTFITEIEKSTLRFIWKHKRPRIAKVVLSKKSNALQTIPQSHSNKKSTVQAQKQIQRPLEQNTRPRYESTQLYPPPLFLTKVPKNILWEKTASSTNVRKTGYLPAENRN